MSYMVYPTPCARITSDDPTIPGEGTTSELALGDWVADAVVEKSNGKIKIFRDVDASKSHAANKAKKKVDDENSSNPGNDKWEVVYYVVRLK